MKIPCCPPEKRRYNHQHLKHLQDVRTFWPKCIDYVMPSDDISKVIELLEDEDRRLDQINGGKMEVHWQTPWLRNCMEMKIKFS